MQPIIYENALEEFLWQLSMVEDVGYVVVTAYAWTSDLTVACYVGREPMVWEIGYGTDEEGEAGFYDLLSDGEMLSVQPPDREEIQRWIVAGLLERLTAERQEFNTRLHERTQGFLRRAAEDRREIGRLEERIDACEMAAAGYLWQAVLLLEEESPWQMPGWWIRLKDVIFQLNRLGVHEGRMDGVLEMIKRLPGVEVDDELDYRQGDATPAAPPEGGTPA